MTAAENAAQTDTEDALTHALYGFIGKSWQSLSEATELLNAISPIIRADQTRRDADLLMARAAECDRAAESDPEFAIPAAYALRAAADRLRSGQPAGGQ